MVRTIGILNNHFQKPFNLHILIFLTFIIGAFTLDTPENIIRGFGVIISSQDILTTDYLELAGLGATLLNVGATSIISVIILKASGVKPNGSTIMSLWLMAGFSFFGKNIFNIWPIIFGGWLYAKHQKEPFINYSLVTILATSLSPTVSFVALDDSLTLFQGIIISTIVGTIIGFIMPPISSNCMKAHSGYNLANVGFASGFVATILMGFFRNIGRESDAVLIWNTQFTNQLFGFLVLIFIWLIVIGLFVDSEKPKHSTESSEPIPKESRKDHVLKSLAKFKKIHSHSGRLVTDYYFIYKESSYINMGVLGLFSLVIIFLLGSELSGPNIGAVFTIAGFGAFGKHVRNIVPGMIGGIIATTIFGYPMNSPIVIQSILFGTCLAPVAGSFGWHYGMVAGFLQICVVTTLSQLHGGLTLYNSGFSGGIVALILVPLIHTFESSND